MPASQKLTDARLSLPLSALTLADSNVRKVAPKEIASLADSILSEGVLQNLVVVTIKKKKGSVATYGVCAGKRRFLALNLLLNEGKITSDYDVPVLIKERDAATVASVIENLHRENMHPVDEFVAFKTLADEGLSISEIALRTGFPDRAVRQRLSLGSASPELLAECLSGRLNLEQLMVLCQVESHEKQNDYWFKTPDNYQRNAHNLRRLIKGEVVKLSHKLVQFVGLDEYKAQGGGIDYDLFEPDAESSITDYGLLESLAVAKLTALAEGLGWSWCEVAFDQDYNRVNSFKAVVPTVRDMTDDEAVQWDRWVGRHSEIEELIEAGEDDYQAEYDEIESSMSVLQDSLLEWGEAKAIGGVYAYVNLDGEPEFVKGLVRKEDAVKFAKAGSTDGKGGADSATVDVSELSLSGSLKETLACVRASVIQAEIVKTPKIGLALLCHSLALTTFFRSYSSCNHYDITVKSHSEALDKQDLNALPSSTFISGEYQAWKGKLPDEPELLSYLLNLPDSELVKLLVFCSSFALKLHYCGIDNQARYSELVKLLDIPVADCWQPTADNFFNRLNKPLIHQVLADAGVGTEGLSDKMKKSEMAARAADLIKQNPAWLPEVLRVDDPQ